ncbi:MAG: Crp/Fnr family transcriptional regulator [Clostridia bacterium]|nr:Crp/Fnr family transcriptional regulator [Clostridia bacterium]
MIKDCKLFKDIDEKRIWEYISAVNGIKRSYGNGQTVIEQGECIDKLGIVISGKLKAFRYSEDGNAGFISSFSENRIFADFLAISGCKKSPVSLTADGVCDVLLIPAVALFRTTAGFEYECKQIAFNLLSLFSDQFFELKDRVYCLTAPTLREKIIRFLSLFNDDGKPFTIPYSRQELAEYLNAERSALSRELMRMVNDGIIDCQGRKFLLKIR